MLTSKAYVVKNTATLSRRNGHAAGPAAEKNKTNAPGRGRTDNLEKSFVIGHRRVGTVL